MVLKDDPPPASQSLRDPVSLFGGENDAAK